MTRKFITPEEALGGCQCQGFDLMAQRAGARSATCPLHGDPDFRKVYESLEEFYAHDERRRRSGEADYGVWWREGLETFPRFRVSYVQATGELYAFRLDHHGTIIILGKVPPDDAEIYYASLDKVLDGWAEKCGQPEGLQWIRDRLAELVKCAWCGGFMGTRAGLSGVSHGICSTCEEREGG